MKKESLKSRIYKYLAKNAAWVNGGKIEELAMAAGYKGSTAARELRYLVEEGKILSEVRKGKRVSSAWYKIKQYVERY